jgi:hypothetical protein
VDPNKDQQGSSFILSIAKDLTDKDGYIKDPNKYRIINDEGHDVTDAKLNDEFYGILRALHAGYDKTRSFEFDTEELSIKRDVAESIVNAYNGLRLAIRPQDLSQDYITDFILKRSYDNLPIKPELLNVVFSYR